MDNLVTAVRVAAVRLPERLFCDRPTARTLDVGVDDACGEIECLRPLVLEKRAESLLDNYFAGHLRDDNCELVTA